MKQALVSALIAALVCGAVLWAEDRLEDDDEPMQIITAPGAAAAPALQVTDALTEDTWVNAARQPGSDKRTLTSAADTVCYLTKVEISGIQGPEDTSACSIEIDDFTGFWQLVATAEEGSRSEIRCNARCFSLTAEGDSQ